MHIPEVDQFFMLGIYGKDEKEDLTDSEKKEFRDTCSRVQEAYDRSGEGRKKGATRMKTKTRQISFAESLRQGLKEGIKFAKGELTLRTVKVPSPPAAIAAKRSNRVGREGPHVADRFCPSA